ncbi:rhodanese-like domain-containing protein [Microbulbifer sp. OS29]|uniref:Rhodanese-like domain-containing protein n=1 Tax=Microbulbifer okhotskensis TaxID=2926617 RepID=A0A9X2ES79_9GAMM|nr:rhodanese-like domain-containing protein [Microbulbifer okhotskensis]MCO1336440.1 rhodanese-like domain-containing protein [Microbulbifer okhotskensis]
MSSAVSRIPAANCHIALEYFQELMTFETDCWDVHHALSNGRKDFVLLDVRSEDAFRQGHIQEAESLPHQWITETTISGYPATTLFIVYCAGPHCNATEKAAIRLAKLGRPVKKLIGGVTGWIDEGFSLVKEQSTSSS